MYLFESVCYLCCLLIAYVLQSIANIGFNIKFRLPLNRGLSGLRRRVELLIWIRPFMWKLVLVLALDTGAPPLVSNYILPCFIRLHIDSLSLNIEATPTPPLKAERGDVNKLSFPVQLSGQCLVWSQGGDIITNLFPVRTIMECSRMIWIFDCVSTLSGNL